MGSRNHFEIERSLSHLLALNLTFQGVNKNLEARYGLSVVQWFFLKTLEQMPAVSPLSLAKALKVTPGTLSQTTNRLERKKLIFVCNDPKDARRKIISLTRFGKDILDSIDRCFKDIFQDIQSIDGELKTVETFLIQARLRCGASPMKS